MTTALEYLKELVDLTGVSGAEEEVVQHVVRMARPLVDSLQVDHYGNVIALRNASAPDARTLVVAAHMDEVGFRIRSIDGNGFLRFERVGGTDNRVLLGQRVWVRGRTGYMTGVIGTKSAHLLTDHDQTSVPSHTDQYIDVGARSAAEVTKMGIFLGSPAGFVGELTELGAETGRYTAHALDDRVGCAVVLAVLDQLEGRPAPLNIVALFTVQEEVGLRGACSYVQGNSFDLGIAVDTTAVDDTPDTGTNHLHLGTGPAIKIMDASLLAHPAIQRGLLQAADTAGVPIQQEILMGIGTDAGALQFGSNIPAGTLSIGTRYTHSPIEVLDAADLDGAVRVLSAFLDLAPELDLRFTQVN